MAHFVTERSMTLVSSESTISMRVVRALVHAVERVGVSRPRIILTARLPPEGLDDLDARLSRADFYRLCEVALDLTGDPALGLHWSEQLSASALDPIAALVAHSETLGHAFSTLTQYHRLLCDDLGYRITEQKDTLLLHCVPLEGASERVQRFLAEVVAARFLGLIRTFRVGALPERVCFEYPAPAYAAEYARVFADRAFFGEPFTGVILERELLSAQSAVRDAELHDSLRAFVEQRIASMTEGLSYTVRVRDLLVRHGAPRRVSMPEIARALGLSERTLRRRLESEGNTFAEVVSTALSIAAKRCLCDEQRTIQETAYELGFTDKTAFHRAFKRWTGMTPAEFRRTHTDQDELETETDTGVQEAVVTH